MSESLIFFVTRSISFSSAHFLRDYNGKCENLHGHNWRVEATIFNKKLDDSGMVVDFHLIDSVLKEIVSDLDHRVLNDLDFFKKNNPTAENIALYIFNRLSDRFGDKVYSVRVFETEKSVAEVVRFERFSVGI